MKALETGSAADIRDILQENPETVNEPFWDHDCEPPLCCAARLNCPATIVQLLLEHGASAEDTDVRGRTPAQILVEAQQKPWEMQVPWEKQKVGGPASMGFFGVSPYVKSAPFKENVDPAPMRFFGSSRTVNAAPFDIWNDEADYDYGPLRVLSGQPLVHAAPFDVGMMGPTMDLFGSSPFVGPAPDVNALEMWSADYSELFKA